MALAADVVIAAQSAYFVQAFTRIGLIPDAGGTYLLPRQMGLAKAMGAAHAPSKRAEPKKQRRVKYRGAKVLNRYRKPWIQN